MHCRCCKKDRLLCVITDNICHFAKLILERSDKRRQRTWKPGSATHNTISCKKQETWSLVHRGKSRKARICQKTKTEYSNSIRSYIIYKRRRKKKKKIFCPLKRQAEATPTKEGKHIFMADFTTSQQRQDSIRATRYKIFKEKRARLYIIRQCVYMLICWREQD